MEEALPRSNIHGWAAAVHSGSMTLKQIQTVQSQFSIEKKESKISIRLIKSL